MKTGTLAQEEAPRADIAALIEEDKAAALAAFDSQVFRAKILGRVGKRRKTARVGALRLLAACGFALLLATWAVLPLGLRGPHGSVDARDVEKALVRAAAWRSVERAPMPAEPALSDDVWRIERALLTWRRRQSGSVDVERALCLASGRRGLSGACPSHTAEDAAAAGARQRLERTLIELEREGTIYRALMARPRT